MDAPPTEEDDVADPKGGGGVIPSALTLRRVVPGSGVVDEPIEDPMRFDVSKSLRSISSVE